MDNDLIHDKQTIIQIIIGEGESAYIYATKASYFGSKVDKIETYCEPDLSVWFSIWSKDKVVCRVNARFVSQVVYDKE